ncbi:hypothetical protein NML43_13825 [Rhodopseudomonas palustris]|nr:hypothetical protein [Rhodopseudomonas palustris]MCP9628168.1 hypothetical protein [Rhodopseudomonas palustris]
MGDDPEIEALNVFVASKPNGRHCEERSDEAIQRRALSWIASLRSQ